MTIGFESSNQLVTSILEELRSSITKQIRMDWQFWLIKEVTPWGSLGRIGLYFHHRRWHGKILSYSYKLAPVSASSYRF